MPCAATAVIERLREPGILVAPEIQFEIVVRVVGESGRLHVAVGAAAHIVGMSGGSVGRDPLFRSARFVHAAEMQCDVLDVVHVIGPEKTAAATIAETSRVVRPAGELEVDVVRRGHGVLGAALHRPRIVLVPPHEQHGVGIVRAVQAVGTVARCEPIRRIAVAGNDVLEIESRRRRRIVRVERVELRLRSYVEQADRCRSESCGDWALSRNSTARSPALHGDRCHRLSQLLVIRSTRC